MFGGLQPTHLILILIVALLLFGPKQLPELGRSIGKAINEFRNAGKEITEGPKQESGESKKDSTKSS